MATLQMKSDSYMFPSSFKNRIAFYYLLSTAFIILITFIAIYLVVQHSVTNDINKDISIEIERHQQEVSVQQGNVQLVDEKEWLESEHTEIEINPVFVQIHDRYGRLLEKSPNLKKEKLKFFSKQKNSYYDSKLAHINIRQYQAALSNNGKIVGYVVIAMSMEEPKMVLDNLRYILFISFPVVLLVLFIVTSVIAGKSIRPVLKIIETSSIISRENLKSRIPMPKNRDELFVLSRTINDLLDRIENAIEREKQFTSDASHELRTPLAVIKGTLEVLIRKPREKEEYEEKIDYCISEVDRLNNLVDQLLLLARFEDQKIIINRQSLALNEIILESLERSSESIRNKKIGINFTFSEHFMVVTDAYKTAIVIDNIISNAVKYSHEYGSLTILLTNENEGVKCEIIDNGIGISSADIEKIYEQFYRSRPTDHPAIKGSGLGLSIVKRLCDLLAITVEIQSTENIGTRVILYFR